MKLTVLALSVLLLAGCASAPSTRTVYAVSHEPPDEVVIYLSADGTARPDPAWLDVDSTKKQMLVFVADGKDLHVTFKDKDQPFKVSCAGNVCTAKIDKPHKNLYEYRYGFSFTSASGNLVERDPIVIIDTIQTLMVP